MPRRRSDLPEPLRDAPFRTGESGVGRNRLAAPDVVRAFRGVHVAADGAADWRGKPAAQALRARCAAALKAVPDRSMFGSLTAARLWGLPLPTRYQEDEPVHVVVRAPTRTPDRPGIAARQRSDRNVRRARRCGLPTVDLHSLFCHLGAVLSEPDLVAIGDALVLVPVFPDGSGRPYATVASLAERLRTYRGRGKARAVRALARVRVGAESRPETLVRLALQDAGLPEPELNVNLYGPDGAFVGRVDLLFREYRVVVEYDGDHHRSDQDTFDHDIDRLDDLGAFGWRVVRIGRRFFRDPDDAVARVRRALRAAGWTGA